jgi:hypothetical protein
MGTINPQITADALQAASKILLDGRASMTNGGTMKNLFNGQPLRCAIVADILVGGLTAHLLEVARDPSRYHAEMDQAPNPAQDPDPAAQFTAYATNFAEAMVATFTAGGQGPGFDPRRHAVTK